MRPTTRASSQQYPWTPEGIDSPPSTQTQSFLHGLSIVHIIGSGVDGVTVRVKRNGTDQHYALKITAFKHQNEGARRYQIFKNESQALPPATKTGNFSNDALLAMQLDRWQIPQLRLDHTLLELHNWLVMQFALGGPERPSNATRIYNWQRCIWTHAVSKQLIPPLTRAPASSDPTDIVQTAIGAKQEVLRLTYALANVRAKRTGQPLKSMNQFTAHDYDSVSLEVQVLLLAYVNGFPMRIVRALDRINVSQYERYLNSRQFFDIWTQIVCTLSFLSKRVRFAHGDLHPGNVMFERTYDVFNYYDRRKVVLIYDLPIVDQLGRVFDWRFFVFNPEYVVRLVDLGRSRSKLDHPSDVERLIKDNIAGQGVDTRTWVGEYPDYYAQRSDAFAFALAAFSDIATLLGAPQYNPADNERIASELYAIGRVMFHALERKPYSNDWHQLSRELASEWRLDQLRTLQAARSYAKRLHETVVRQTEASYGCIQHTLRSEECPYQHFPSNPVTDPGRWTLDEHLVLFCEELNGYQRAGNSYEPFTRVRSRQLMDLLDNPSAYRVIEMLPPDVQRPQEGVFAQRQKAPYPIFRCLQTGNSYLDVPIQRYREELAAAAAASTMY